MEVMATPQEEQRARKALRPSLLRRLSTEGYSNTYYPMTHYLLVMFTLPRPSLDHLTSPRRHGDSPRPPNGVSRSTGAPYPQPIFVAPLAPVRAQITRTDRERRDPCGCRPVRMLPGA